MQQSHEPRISISSDDSIFVAVAVSIALFMVRSIVLTTVTKCTACFLYYQNQKYFNHGGKYFYYINLVHSTFKINYKIFSDKRKIL